MRLETQLASVKFAFYYFKVPLRSNIVINKKQSIAEREGILVELTDLAHKKQKSYGIIAPLPGINQENLKSLIDEIKEKEIFQQELTLQLDNFNPTAPFFNLIQESFFQSASLIYGIEEALYHYYYNFIQDDFVNQLRLNPIRIAFFLKDDDLDKILFQKWPSPITIKIKIGRDPRNLGSELTRLKKIIDHNPSVQIRIDPNDFLDDKDEKKILNFIERSNFDKKNALDCIDYFEDFIPTDQNATINKKYFLALDHTLSQYLQIGTNNQITIIKPIPKNLKAIIIRPSQIGLSASMALINFCKQHSIHSIFSSSYDHAYSLNTFSFIMVQNKIDEYYHGLDTLKFFEKDIFLPPKLLAKGLFFPHLDLFKSFKPKRKSLAIL